MRASGALLASDEPDAVIRQPENVRLSRTEAARSPGRLAAPYTVSDSPVRLALPRSQRPQLGAQIIPFVLPSSAPTLDGGFCPADHALPPEVAHDDLAHDVPVFLFRAVGLKGPPSPSGEP